MTSRIEETVRGLRPEALLSAMRGRARRLEVELEKRDDTLTILAAKERPPS